MSGRVDVLATMSLMQMIADAYESAHDMWEHDEESSSSFASSPPNEAQQAVRAWLAYTRFLPPLPPKQLPRGQPSIQTEASSLTILNPPRETRSNKWRLSMGSLKLPRKRTHSGSTNLSSPSESLSMVLPSPSNLCRRRRATTSSTTVSESSPLDIPSKSSSRSLPTRSFTTPTYTKRPRFPTKIPYRQGSTLDDVQEPPPPTQTPTRSPLSDAPIQSVFHSPSDIPTPQSTSTLSVDGPTFTTPWLTQSLSSPSLRSSTSTSFDSRPWSGQKPVLDKDLLQDRPQADVTLWTLFVLTMLGYLFFFFLFLGCFLIAIFKLFKIFFWSATDE